MENAVRRMRDMDVRTLAHFVHKQFLWLLLGCYAVAGVFPTPGLWMRDLSFGHLIVAGQSTRLSLPVLLLALLLWNAGLGARTGQLSALVCRPGALLTGVVASLVVPLAFIFLVAHALRLWHNPDEVQNILVGLALVAAMPIAGSSTAWSQKANGNMVLSLGLVLASTLLSPLTTPVALHSVGMLTTGRYAEDLHELAASGAGLFLGLGVVAPSLLGILTRCLLGEARLTAAGPSLKLLNAVVLLTLLYSNASTSLPQAVSERDWDFLAVMLVIVVGLCATAFGSGWLLARLLKAGPAEQASLMYGLGMSNNGTGLVLASMALAAHPMVMLPVIFYNLVQHLIAGLVDFRLCRETRPVA